MGWFGGSDPEKVAASASRQYAVEREASAKFAEKLIGQATPEEQELIAKAKASGLSDLDSYNAAMESVGKIGATIDEQVAGLGKLDDADWQRRYGPAFERLMMDYEDMDRGVIENMNQRGIASIGSSDTSVPVSAGSEPEMYQRNLLARETKRELGNIMKETQSQSLQQKVQDVGASTMGSAARLGQASQGYTGFQGMLGQQAISPSERTKLKANIASGGAAAAGQTVAGQGIQSGVESQIASTQARNQMLGAGLGALSTLGASMIKSSEDVKENIVPHSDESALARLMQTEPKEWNYKGDDQTNVGPIAEETPEPIATPDHKAVNLNNYLSELTGAVRALAKRVHGSGLQGIPQS